MSVYVWLIFNDCNIFFVKKHNIVVVVVVGEELNYQIPSNSEKLGGGVAKKLGIL